MRGGFFETPAKTRVGQLGILNQIFMLRSQRAEEIGPQHVQRERLRPRPFLFEPARNGPAAAQGNLIQCETAVGRGVQKGF